MHFPQLTLVIYLQKGSLNNLGMELMRMFPTAWMSHYQLNGKGVKRTSTNSSWLILTQLLITLMYGIITVTANVTF